MGVTASWISVQGQDREAFLERLGLTKVGECSDHLIGDYTCTELPNGWFVVVANARRFELIPTLKSVSARGFVLGGQMVETVNFSQLCGYEGGAQVWSVVSDREVEVDKVRVEGVPPSAFAEIHAEKTKMLEAEPNPADYMFDLPLDLSVAVCSFRPDQFEFPEWAQLARKDQLSKRDPIELVSLRAEMDQALTSFMLIRGWTQDTSERQRIGIRFHRPLKHYVASIEFQYSSYPDPWIQSQFDIEDVGADGGGILIWGFEEDRTPRIPFWKRLLGLEKTPPPPADPIGTQIERAKTIVADIEAFMETGEIRPTLNIVRTRR